LQDFCSLLIKEDLRDLPWSIGVVEYWNDGLREEKNNRSMPFDFSYPVLQFSTIPSFHVDGPHFSSRFPSSTTVFSTKLRRLRDR